MREEKLREIQSALKKVRSARYFFYYYYFFVLTRFFKKDEPPAAAAPALDPEEILSFCLQVPASARRIKGTMHHGIFTGQQVLQ